MIVPDESPRIGVYICHCGSNIAATVDIAALAKFAEGLPDVVLVRDYKYMCSDPGQQLLKRDIGELGLNRVVVAACSPNLHEPTFRRAAEDAGLNRFLVQIANIREQVSWVTDDPAQALEKAMAHLAAAIRRVAAHKPLQRQFVRIVPRAMVVGGGIAGIQAALTLAEAGREVILVEREPSIGGHMAMFDKTFPTLDCAACILTPKMTAARLHPNIQLWTYSTVEAVEGSVGRYRVKVRRRPRYIDDNLCVGCMMCLDACVFTKPKFPNPFDQGLGLRKPVWIPFPQAVPPVPVIDPETCLQLTHGKCKQTCVQACGERNAIDFTQQERIEEVEVGTIVVATGFKIFDPAAIPYYGYGKYPNVYTSLQVERMLNAGGPTAGKVLCHDGSPPRRVGIIHCVGSRDANFHPYCSRVCCMYALKLAHLIREKTAAEVINCYIDIRAPGKGFEEFYNRVQNEGVQFIRGKVADITPKNADPAGPLVMQVDDTLLGKIRAIEVDMVVLAVALEAQGDADEVRRTLGISCSAEGFFLEKHPKLAPVNTASDGVLVAGACQGPKDIPDTVAQADAAAAKALALIDAGQIELEPNVAWIDETMCSGCQTCVGLCPYRAITPDLERKVAVIDAALCKGCGTCVAACPSGAAKQHLFTNEQVDAELEGLMNYV
jgi:heterodisulfide reductase subunit A